MMDIKIHRRDKTATAIENGKVVKAKELEPEEFKDLMCQLCGDSIDMVRTATKLFKVKSYTFKDVKL